jgi:hypothetical protein
MPGGIRNPAAYPFLSTLAYVHADERVSVRVLRWDGMGWASDGIGWDGTRWDGMG